MNFCSASSVTSENFLPDLAASSEAFLNAARKAALLLDSRPLAMSDPVPYALWMRLRNQLPASSIESLEMSPSAASRIPSTTVFPSLRAGMRDLPMERNRLSKPLPEDSDAYSRKLTPKAMALADDMSCLLPER